MTSLKVDDALRPGLSTPHGGALLRSGAPAAATTSPPPGSDAEQYIPGSRDDFDRLYRTAYPRIHATLRSLLRDPAAAEDCAQEAFAKAFKAWSRWEQDAPAEAWVHRIAINSAVSLRRRERLRHIGEILRRVGPPEPTPDPSAALGQVLIEEVRRLPAKQAAVLVLRHLHGYTNRDIAAALGIPEATIASRLAAAKARLREWLEWDGAEAMVTSSAASVSTGKDANGRR